MQNRLGLINGSKADSIRLANNTYYEQKDIFDY